MKKIAIGMPVYDGRLDAESAQQIHIALYAKQVPVQKVIYEMGDSLVSRARNKIAMRFLETDCDYLMFIDSDIRFNIKMIEQLLAHDKKVIGGIYLKKKLPYEPVLNTTIGNDGDLLVMKETGTGFLMIHREVFEAIKKAEPEHSYNKSADEADGEYYDWFRVGVVENRYLSEDYYFCHLARKYGYKVYVDSSVVVGHVGKLEFPLPNPTNLIDGATELLAKFNPNVELDMQALDRLQAVITHQKQMREK